MPLLSGMKTDRQYSFNQEDIRELAPQIINAALARIEAGGTPEKIAENDFLMKCTRIFAKAYPILHTNVIQGVMRVILTARTLLSPEYKSLLQRFINILGAIAKNPSNPAFDQYIFESISALIRCDLRLLHY